MWFCSLTATRLNEPFITSLFLFFLLFMIGSYHHCAKNKLTGSGSTLIGQALEMD